MEELRLAREASQSGKKRGEHRVKKEKDPMDAIKKKIEMKMLENKMEKKIDSKVYYSQDK